MRWLVLYKLQDQDIYNYVARHLEKEKALELVRRVFKERTEDDGFQREILYMTQYEGFNEAQKLITRIKKHF